MPNYIFAVLTAFVQPVAHAWSNIIDSHFSNHVFPKLSVLVLFSMVFNLIFLPFVIFFSPPHMLSLPLIGLLFLIALIEVLYLFPYFWSLQSIDTSIVAALFSLGQVLIPILAFFLLHERLGALRYSGFALIIISAIMLTIDFKKLHVNGAFFFMLGASFMLAIEALLYKYVYMQGASWGSVVVPVTLFQVLIALPIALFAGFGAIKEGIKNIRDIGWLFLGNEALVSMGNLSNSFALFALPVSIAKAIAATQPAFVFAYAIIFRKSHGDFFKEEISKAEGLKKLLFFGLTVIGTILVVV